MRICPGGLNGLRVGKPMWVWYDMEIVDWLGELRE